VVKSTAMSVVEIFSDIAELIARMNPQQVIRLKAPQQMSDRVDELMDKKKEGLLTSEEASELERFLALDLFISLTKASAQILLAK
jgi:CBS domain containing-hemolysin-like protein